MFVRLRHQVGGNGDSLFAQTGIKSRSSVSQRDSLVTLYVRAELLSQIEVFQ